MKKVKTKTYNSEDSLVVTHPTTNSPACGLSTAERTGSPVFHTLWSYVSGYVWKSMIECGLGTLRTMLQAYGGSTSAPQTPRHVKK
ncbi:hypothetical protein VN97_g208 [Penicillium thymicola]|uniref:Uncharacterized protein n=1 Tax=Penicillium thymicola TaxID=293382 RepID=A0AAI9XDE8_PENTH|nr:hypothetical protein VN97_g208 [Penicillium thymicola]